MRSPTTSLLGRSITYLNAANLFRFAPALSSPCSVLAVPGRVVLPRRRPPLGVFFTASVNTRLRLLPAECRSFIEAFCAEASCAVCGRRCCSGRWRPSGVMVVSLRRRGGYCEQYAREPGSCVRQMGEPTWATAGDLAPRPHLSHQPRATLACRAAASCEPIVSSVPSASMSSCVYASIPSCRGILLGVAGPDDVLAVLGEGSNSPGHSMSLDPPSQSQLQSPNVS